MLPGERIRQLREARGLTQAQLAKGVISRSAISMLEAGRYTPTLEVLARLAKRLGIPVAELNTEKERLRTYRLARLLVRSSRHALDQGEPTRARSLAGEALKLVDGGDPAMEAEAHEVLAQAFMREGNTQRAVEVYREALDLASRSGDDLLRARLLKGLGNCHYRLQNYREAAWHYRKALDLVAGRDELLRVQLLFNLGTSYNQLTVWDQALANFRAALNAPVTDSDPLLLGRTLYSLGCGQRGMGDLAAAEVTTRRAIEVLRDTEHEADRWAAEHNLGLILCERGFWRDGYSILTRCEATYRRLGDKVRLARVLEEQARYWLHMQNVARARECIAEARVLADDAGDKYQRGRSCLLWSRLEATHGDSRLAEELFRQARDWLGQLGVSVEGVERQQWA